MAMESSNSTTSKFTMEIGTMTRWKAKARSETAPLSTRKSLHVPSRVPLGSGSLIAGNSRPVDLKAHIPCTCREDRNL